MKASSIHNSVTLIIAILLLLTPILPTLSATIIVNGDFEAGNTGFSSQYTYKADDVNRNDEMVLEGTYGVGYNAYDYHGSWLNSGDHTSGSGKMFIANGSDNTSYIVWQGTVNQDLVIGTTYDFSAWMIDLYTAEAHASLTFKADGVTIGTLTLETYQTWTRLIGTFTAQSLRPTFTLTNAVSASGGNDFAVDDINVFYEGTTNMPETATLTTTAAASITASSALLGGAITSDGGLAISEKGVVYSSTDTEPFINETGVTKDVNSAVGNDFTKTIGPLAPGTTFYFQAYATNAAGTNYGGVEFFTTSNASITFTNGSSFSPSVSPGNTNQVLGRFQLATDVAGASLKAASIRLDGTRTGLTNLKLWSSTDASFASGSDTQLGATVAIDPGDGAYVSFSGFTSGIGTENTFYFLTGDLASNATGAVQGVLVNDASLTLDKGSLSAPITNAPLSSGDTSLPVELASFTAENKNNTVELTWSTASESDNLGFILERKSENTIWQQIVSYQSNDALAGKGTAASPSQYSFTDASIKAGNKYIYRLSDVSTNGESNVIGTISVETNALPASTQLFAAYPNPFNPSTNLKYQLANDSHVTLAVYDVLGRQITILVNQQQTAGEYAIHWNGTDNMGISAPSGTYLVRMSTENMSQIRKITFLK